MQMFAERYLVDSMKCLRNVHTNIRRMFYEHSQNIRFLNVRQMLDFPVCGMHCNSKFNGVLT